MSHEMSHMGPRAFNHDNSTDAEAEYDRLRDLARQEASKRAQCFSRSKEAYSNGDGAGAKQLSEEGKAHGRKMEEYNNKASEFIFRENNASGRVEADTIDLHGQFVEEAEEILEERIKYAKSHGQNHLHVIVGKGNPSANHVQKIKPRVEQVCRELGLQYTTEENAGRIYVNLTGGEAVMPPLGHQGGSSGDTKDSSKNNTKDSSRMDKGQQQHGQGQQQPDELEELAKEILPKILRKLEKACCVVM
ncbi:hypothetical protein PDIDSM_405 [Penicillium digitatum]|nr:hypothetical protein PDIDSM_405 [Penicillium digitatum]